MVPIRYTLTRRAATISRTGIGSERSRSLSFDRYRAENVLKTLPKAPSTIDMPPSIRKYIHPRSFSQSGPHRVRERLENIPPSITTIIMKKRMK